jgi:hypothetical protein
MREAPNLALATSSTANTSIDPHMISIRFRHILIVPFWCNICHTLASITCCWNIFRTTAGGSSRAIFGETVMSWTIAIVAISLAMAVLTIAELWQPVKVNALRMPDQIFAAITFSIIFIYGLVLIAAKILLWHAFEFCASAFARDVSWSLSQPDNMDVVPLIRPSKLARA